MVSVAREGEDEARTIDRRREILTLKFIKNCGLHSKSNWGTIDVFLSRKWQDYICILGYRFVFTVENELEGDKNGYNETREKESYWLL